MRGEGVGERGIAVDMKTVRPGFNPARMIRLMRETMDRINLDLSGLVVLTEAATGAYAVTPVLAAMAGADRVYALAKSSRHGSRAEVAEQTHALSRLAAVGRRIQLVERPTKRVVGEADIITNSGHVRPIDARKIGWMKPTAVIPLMYEDWEFRSSDIDLEACRRKGIRVMGTNEQHPDIDVFGYLGVLAMKQLMDAGVSVYRSRILLLSDNAFRSFIERALVRAGATVDSVSDYARPDDSLPYDAILLAMRPRREMHRCHAMIKELARRCPETLVVQFYGDIDRAACAKHGIHVWPAKDPGGGHMGILPSEIGPEATIRLQAGGLKAGAEALAKGSPDAWSYATLLRDK